MVRNMTKGSPARLLVSFALPVLAGGLAAQGYSLVDAIVVGQAIGAQGFAAIGAVSNIDGLVIGFGMMMIQGFAIPIAQRFGAQDEAGLRASVAHAFLLTLAAAIVLMAAGLLTLGPFMRLLRVPEALTLDGQAYIRVLFLGMPVPLLSHMAYAALRSLGDSRTPLMALLLSSLLNIGLDVALILGLGLGTWAAALASILAQLFMWPWLWRRMRRIAVLRLPATAFRPQAGRVRGMLGMSLPLALQNSVAVVGVLVLQAVVNDLGVAYVAAFGAVIRILYFMKAPSEAIGHALAAYVGQNTGAGTISRVRAGIRAAILISLPICAVAMAIMCLFGGQMAAWVVTAQELEAIAMAALLLRILGGMLPVLYLMYVLRAALQGMGHTVVLMASGAVEMALRSVCALTLPLVMGAAGIGIAETSAWLGAMLLYAVRLPRVLRSAEARSR